MIRTLPYVVSQVGIDPTPWTAWGVLGLLGLVVIVLVGILWKLFNTSTAAMETQAKTIMNFVDVHRSETNRALSDVTDKSNKALESITDKMVSSQDRMTGAFSKVARVIDELVLLERIYDRASKRPAGTPLTDDEVEKIVRIVRSQGQNRE